MTSGRVGDVAVYGQECNSTTRRLAMIEEFEAELSREPAPLQPPKRRRRGDD